MKRAQSTQFSALYKYICLVYVYHHYHLGNLFSCWIVAFSSYFRCCCCRSGANDFKNPEASKLLFSLSIFISCVHLHSHAVFSLTAHRKCKNYGFGVWKKMMMFFWLKAKQTKWKLPKSLKHSEASIISAHVSIPSSTHFTLHFIFLPKANMSELRYAWTTFRKCFSSHSAYIDHCTKSTCIDFARCFRFCLKWILESKCFWKGIKGKYHGICERFYSERAHFDFMKILAKENNVRNVTIEIA